MNTRINLDNRDYEQCLEFILKLWYLWGAPRGDFRSSGVSRDIGKYINDHIAGKLAEIAVCKFMEREHGISIRADFDEYVSAEDFEKGDIVSLNDNGQWRETRVIIDVKHTKPTSRWELVPRNLQSTEASNYFVFVSVDIPPDHIIRYFKENLDFIESRDVIDNIPRFGNIEAEIVGLLDKETLIEIAITLEADDKLPEINIFHPRVRATLDTLNVIKEPPTVELIVGSFSHMEFNITGSLILYEGEIRRIRDKKDVMIFEQYMQCNEQCVLVNDHLGEYVLEEGLYKIINEDLTTLREDNYAIPVKLITCSEAQWRTLVEKI